MAPITRRSFIQSAIVLGAASAWADPFGAKSQIQWTERRDLYPEGVASGDPDEHSVLLWTRHSPGAADSAELNVEVADDESFSRVVATARAPISRESDWTCRVLVGGLKPSHIYWYRFTDSRRFWKPRRTNHHRAGDHRSQAGPLCFRELSECQSGRAERLPPHDFRGRARRCGGPSGIRSPSWRLHLRDRLVSRGPATRNV